MIDESMFEKRIPDYVEHDVIYVHQCFMSMFSGMLNWISTTLYPRFNYKVITTYDKAVEVFRKKKQNVDGQVQAPFLPALTLDPILDFSNEERAGRFLWMFRNLDTQKQSTQWKEIKISDQGVTITPRFTRYQGTVEITAWMPSIYELIDFRVKLIQYFGGYQRWIRPELFWTHLIIPKEIIESEGPQGKIDWSAINPKIITLETTNTKEYALPFQMDAIWRLDSCGDATNKMGSDQIADYKLTATLTWEANIPTYIRLENYKYPIENIKLGIGLTPVQCKYPMNMSYNTYYKLNLYQKLTHLANLVPIYNISENVNPIIKFDDSMCYCTPDKYQSWNHYVIGKVYDITKLKEPEEINDLDSILVIDEFDESYIPYIRRCRGLVSHYDKSTNCTLKDIIDTYNISAVLDINNKQLFNAIKSLHGKDITFDVVGQCIFSGRHKIKCYHQYDDFKTFTFPHNIAKLLKKYNCDFIFKDEKLLPYGIDNIQSDLNSKYDYLVKEYTAEENQHEFPLDVTINQECIENFGVGINGKLTQRYKITETTIFINEDVEIHNGDKIQLYRNNYCSELQMFLVCNYIMTREDERQYYNNKKPLEIQLNEDIDMNFMKIISYTGELQKDFDYILDEPNKKIIFKLEPQRDEYIQIFGCKK